MECTAVLEVLAKNFGHEEQEVHVIMSLAGTAAHARNRKRARVNITNSNENEDIIRAEMFQRIQARTCVGESLRADFEKSRS